MSDANEIAGGSCESEAFADIDDDGFRQLACGVIQIAIDDLRKTVPRYSRAKSSCEMAIRQDSARFFLIQGANSYLNFWCSVAGINRIVMQERLKKELWN